MDLRLSQKIDSMVSIIHAQIMRAINSAMNSRVFPEIQKVARNLALREKEIEAGATTCRQGPSDMADGCNIILTKEISRFAFAIRDEAGLGPSIYGSGYSLVFGLELRQYWLVVVKNCPKY